MYETLEQKEPVFDAKGIETVRRDTCPAVAKVSPARFSYCAVFPAGRNINLSKQEERPNCEE